MSSFSTDFATEMLTTGSVYGYEATGSLSGPQVAFSVENLGYFELFDLRFVFKL